MMRPEDSARFVSRGLTFLGLAALAVVTVAYPGATRMYAWPWSLAYAIACFTPVVMFWFRLFDSRRPIVLPSPGWCAALLLGATTILASALASPYRGSCLLWSAPLLAGLALVLVTFDWLHSAADELPLRRQNLLVGTGIFSAVVVVVSLALWSRGLFSNWRDSLFFPSNPFPLGHSNYTAGLTLLALPVFVGLIFPTRGVQRVGWILAALLALVLLYTSGSRGGLIGLVVLALANVVVLARALRLNLWLIALPTAVVLTALFYYNPRARSLVFGGAASNSVRASNEQRSAMLTAGLALGRERPLLGWGAGATPLAYPRVRHLLRGGVEDVLQQHSTPLQLYAEFGAAGVCVALLFIVLAARAARNSRPARIVFLGLAGYAVFSVTDWQLDVPVFACALAFATAFLAEPGVTPPALRQIFAAFSVVALGLFAIFARPDPAPELNVRALAIGREPAQMDSAIALLRQSLGLNPNQEIAHFNLGWLLVTRDPAAAERHFLVAAHLVPDKGGVYFGLALARLNQGQRASATRALAVECINDPLFLTSPWWRLPAVGELRAETMALADSLLASLESLRPPVDDVRYLRALIGWLNGHAVPGEILATANTSARVGYFARRPSRPDFSAATIRVYRRDRTAYPVLMRNLDLPAPTDLFDVQENELAVTELGFLFPRKGWLPAPSLLALLDAPVATTHAAEIKPQK